MSANPQFQASNPADVRPFFGDVAEKTTAQTKNNLERMGAAAAEATNQMKDVYSTTFKGVQEYSAKALEFTNLNVSAAVEHAKNLASVKSPAEFWALTAEHLRQQFERSRDRLMNSRQSRRRRVLRRQGRSRLASKERSNLPLLEFIRSTASDGKPAAGVSQDTDAKKWKRNGRASR